MLPTYDNLLRTRLPSIGVRSIDRGGRGDCWFYSIAAEIGMSMEDLRRGVAQHMRENEHIYGSLGDFKAFGGYQRYCDRVGTCGVFVEGNAELAATADYISRHILILGADKSRDVYLSLVLLPLVRPFTSTTNRPLSWRTGVPCSIILVRFQTHSPGPRREDQSVPVSKKFAH